MVHQTVSTWSGLSAHSYSRSTVLDRSSLHDPELSLCSEKPFTFQLQKNQLSIALPEEYENTHFSSSWTQEVADIGLVTSRDVPVAICAMSKLWLGKKSQVRNPSAKCCEPTTLPLSRVSACVTGRMTSPGPHTHTLPRVPQDKVGYALSSLQLARCLLYSGLHYMFVR